MLERTGKHWKEPERFLALNFPVLSNPPVVITIILGFATITQSTITSGKKKLKKWVSADFDHKLWPGGTLLTSERIQLIRKRS